MDHGQLPGHHIKKAAGIGSQIISPNYNNSNKGMENSTTMEQDLQSVIESAIVKYRGCLIYIKEDGFQTGRDCYTTLQGAMGKIDKTFLTWNESLTKNIHHGNTEH